MGKDSKIQWTDHTWNPWHGCKKVSPGCKYCYMYRDKERYKKDPTEVVRSSHPTFYKPLTWDDPGLVFTCSWSDFFIEEADPWRDEAWKIIRNTPHLTYQILTKRPERIVDHLPEDWIAAGHYENVWLGVSIESEDQIARKYYLENAIGPILFLSMEPLLGPVELTRLDLQFIDWVIIGGESGNDTGKYRYRPMELHWMENIIAQCQDYDIPVFVKQLGPYQAKKLGLKDRFGGDISEWPKDLQIRQFPKCYNYETKEI